MISKEFSEAAVEVLDILNNVDKSMVKKIPDKFINFLKEQSSKEYKANIDYTKPAKEFKLKEKTEAILGLIYLKYWADEEGRAKFEKRIKANDEFFAKQLKTEFKEDMFDKTINQPVEQTPVDENKLLKVDERKQNIISKIINNIKKFFKG